MATKPDRLPFSPIKRALAERLAMDSTGETSIAQEHALIEQALAELEALADGLPALPAPSVMTLMIAYLREAIPAHCAHEEMALRRARPTTDAYAGAIPLILAEHQTNAAIGQELADMLDDCRAAGSVAAPEALGQLTRQYFLLMRRHLAWEDFILDRLLGDDAAV